MTARWALRVHRALMPDYGPRASAFWWSISLAGLAVIGSAAFALVRMPDPPWLHLLGASLLAVLAGLVPVRTPGSSNAFTAGEIFLFLLLLVHGPEAATLAAAIEAAVASWRVSRRWTSRIASPAIAATAMYTTGSAFAGVVGALGQRGVGNDAVLLFGSLVFALAYFAVNTVLGTTIPRLKRGERFDLAVLVRAFGWLSMAYVGSACVAAFLSLSFRQSGIVVVVAALPVIAILLVTGHFFFKRQEADLAVQQAEADRIAQTARHLAELEVSERRFQSAFTRASIGMALVAFDGRVRQANPALTALLGWSGDSSAQAGAMRLDFSAFVADDGRTTLADALVPLQRGATEALSIELRSHHRDGGEIWVAAHGAFFSEPAEAGSASAEPWLILQMQDITARRRAQSELGYIAFHDSLTGLANRHRFHQQLAIAIERHAADPTRDFGVMFLDCDRFKLINDSMGHPVGDAFLQLVSRRIEENLRPGDVVARLGGDEFAVLAEDRAPSRTVVALADRLLVALQQPFRLGETEIASSASIGITFGTLGYATPEDVLRDADIAMYKAKSTGKARHAIFDASLHTELAHRLKLESDLRRALADGKLEVHYQPLYDLQHDRLIGFEALARWRHPELGPISPASFIPVAEESGSMVQLTDFVLRRACRDLKRWQRMGAAWADLTVHVNIAANDLAGANFVARVTHAIVEARIEPQYLTVELTENILMERLEAAIGKLEALSALGIGLSVDDFGTGYSSLAHLSTLPFDSLKIDRSFVHGAHAGSKEAAVIKAVVLLGKSLGKHVIAEGIETVEQRELLKSLGCDAGQGFLLARPLPRDEIDALLGVGGEPAVTGAGELAEA